MRGQAQTIELSEYQTRSFPAADMPQEVGRQIWSRYGEKIALEAPTFQTNHEWRLTSLGWVGHIPITENLNLLLQPKVELGNLFRMLEYAYKVSFETLGDVVGASSLIEFYERLARVLSLRAADRTRKGLYREYASREHALPFVRGRINLESMVSEPWNVEIDCRYHENTADVEDNQLIAWALFCIARSGLCGEETGKIVRRAYRGLRNSASLQHLSADACVGRHYNRLNQDYRPLHGLCRFFLENTGPTHEQGKNVMLPFLLDMARLFEAFVAEWLNTHLPPDALLKDQVTVQVGAVNKVDFRIDLLLTDRRTGHPLCLLDTKYKAPAAPDAADVQQVIAYAKTLGCREAVLVYPKALDRPLDDVVGRDIHVWTTEFNLAGDLEANGSLFLDRVMEAACSHPVPMGDRLGVHHIRPGWVSIEATQGMSEVNDGREEKDLEFNGWRKAPYSLDSVLAGYPHIWLAEGYRLAGYQYSSGMNSNGFVFTIPKDKELPAPPDEGLDFGWLRTGATALAATTALPQWVESDVAAFLRGDETPLSYFEASLCMRELWEMGAGWHGIHWGAHKLITSTDEAEALLSEREGSPSERTEWQWLQDKPTEWLPCVRTRADGVVTVEFFTCSELGQQAVYLHRDVYGKGYEFVSEQIPIGTGGGGYLF